jgi:hypothetical protein
MSNQKVRKIREAVGKALAIHGGQITAEQLVGYARANPDGVLYGCFTWDDDAAAAKCRLVEAQGLLRQYKVVYQPPAAESKKIVVRGAWSLPSDRQEGGGLYRSIEVIQSDEAKRQELIKLARQELKAFRQKYGILRELFSGVFDAIEALERDQA